MSEKRYVIVRVDDDECPEYIEDFKCHFPNNSVECMKCSHHRYGDTKEQLVLKVQQALFKSVFTEQVQKAVSIEEQKRIYKQYRPMAEKVVEFLGAE
jgi:hypothetical protein